MERRIIFCAENLRLVYVTAQSACRHYVYTVGSNRPCMFEVAQSIWQCTLIEQSQYSFVYASIPELWYLHCTYIKVMMLTNKLLSDDL